MSTRLFLLARALYFIGYLPQLLVYSKHGRLIIGLGEDNSTDQRLLNRYPNQHNHNLLLVNNRYPRIFQPPSDVDWMGAYVPFTVIGGMTLKVVVREPLRCSLRNWWSLVNLS